MELASAPPSVGRAAITADARGFMSAFPDLVIHMDSIESHGPGFVYRWTLTGMNSGPGGTGNRVRISGWSWADG